MKSLKTIMSFAFSFAALNAGTVSSPDGRLTVEVGMSATQSPVYRIHRDGRPVLQESRLGLVRDDADFSRGLKLNGESESEPVEDHYEILTAKRRVNTYHANRKIFHFATADKEPMDVIFQVSDDGVAFRYRFPDLSEEPHSLKEEVSSFHFLPGTVAWLQPMAKAKEGWKRTQPSYEEYYEMEVPVGTPSRFGAGWIFPALFHSGETWIVISETGLDRNYCGCRLRHESPDGEYSIGFADPKETMNGKPAHPVSTLPWETPWRVIAIGDLRTVTESMLGVDLAPPAVAPPAPWIKPGKASWSWVLMKDDATVYDVQKQFVDYAADMGWAYCLVDALWDVQIGDERIGELSAYAQTKGVGLLLWYNSNGIENDAPQTPRNRLLTPESRAKEFAWLKSIGVKGLKVDFFGGDGQPVINYYLDLIQDAAKFDLMINFHGATIPRGWERTYPNLVTMEAIRGLEYVTFTQDNADHEPSHAAMLPFTRNIFDPMDFTPVAMEGIPNIERRTTSAFELATAVLFTSGIQHYADTPAGMAKMPDYVRTLMREVPSVWDDVHFVDGYPGKYVVMARLGGGRWHVAGINGSDEPQELSLDLSFLPGGAKLELITDGDGALFQQSNVNLTADRRFKITIEPHGGFVLVAH